MKAHNHDEPRSDSNLSNDDHEEAPSREDHREIVTTTDPAIATGRGGDEARDLEPDETIIAETSRVTHSVPSNAPQAKAVVERSKKPDEPAQNKGRSDSRDESKGGDHHHPGDRNAPAHSGRPGWMSLVLTGLVALVCGVTGAWAFSHYESKNKDQSKNGGHSEQGKQGGEGSSKNHDSSNARAGEESGAGKSSSDSGPEASAPISSAEAKTLKKQMQSLSSQFDSLQQRFDSFAELGKNTSRDIGTLQVKVKELSCSVQEVADVPSRMQPLEKEVDRLREVVNGLRFQLTTEKVEVGAAPDARAIGAENRKVESPGSPPPTPPASAAPTEPISDDAVLTDAIALFKRGQYKKADDIFSRLQTTRPQDARVWYFSALAHGFDTGQWEGDTKRLVMNGAARERAGSPSALQIDATFADLTPAQGKEWLDAYRSKLVKH